MKLLAIPFSGGGLGRGNGANKAPEIIMKQLAECFANEDGVSPVFEKETLVLDEQNIQESHDIIEEKVGVLQEPAILLGGDHSITYPAVRGFSQSVHDFFFIVFDAHPDLMDDFRPPTQEDYLKVLIEDGIVNPEQCILIGIRNWDEQEVLYLKEKNIMYYSMQTIFDMGFKQVMQEIKEKVNKPFYLSLDIDVVDPTEAIGTGYIEHGGLSSRELIYAIKELKATNRMRMADIVEVNPDKDVKELTSKLAAKLVTELY